MIVCLAVSLFYMFYQLKLRVAHDRVDFIIDVKVVNNYGKPLLDDVTGNFM